MIFIDTELKAV